MRGDGRRSCRTARRPWCRCHRRPGLRQIRLLHGDRLALYGAGEIARALHGEDVEDARNRRGAARCRQVQIAFDQRRIEFADRRDAETGSNESLQHRSRRSGAVDPHMHHHRTVRRDDVDIERGCKLGIPRLRPTR